jgi:hypothetical protein
VTVFRTPLLATLAMVALAGGGLATAEGTRPVARPPEDETQIALKKARRVFATPEDAARLAKADAKIDRVRGPEDVARIAMADAKRARRAARRLAA